MRSKQPSAKIIFFAALIGLAELLLVSPLSGAASVPNGAGASKTTDISWWEEFPAVQSALEMSGNKFDLKSQFKLQQSISFERVKSFVHDDNVIKDFVPALQSVKTSAESNGQYRYSFTAKDFWGDEYSQAFLCRDSVNSSTVLDEDCFEQPTKETAKNARAQILTGGALSIDCFSTQSIKPLDPSLVGVKGVQCIFELSGRINSLATAFTDMTGKKIPAEKVAHYILNALTSYTTQIGLLAGNDVSNPSQTQDFLKSTGLGRKFTFDRLQGHKLGFGNLTPGKTFIVKIGSDGTFSERIQYGDYALESIAPGAYQADNR